MARFLSRSWFSNKIAAFRRWRPTARRAGRAGLSPVEVLEQRLLLNAAPGAFGQLPLSFEANLGQADSHVQYLARGGDYGLFLAGQEVVLTLSRSATLTTDAAGGTVVAGGDTLQASETSVLRLRLAGANAAAPVVAEQPLEGVSNYLFGADPADWIVNVPHYGRVEYRGVYEGIDVVYYGNQQNLQYDLELAPHADVGQIALEFDGADALRIAADGSLVIAVGSAELVQHAPVIYQDVDGARQLVTGGFVLREDGSVGFSLGAYDPNLPLVIDPALTYSTYAGGNGTDQGYGVAVDGSGNAYLAGFTSSSNFPVAGAAQATLAGNHDVFVTKLNAAGTARLYSTYFGGSGDDRAFGIALDGNGNAYVTGMTSSTNLPGTAGKAQATRGGGTWDGFVAKLNAAGNALEYATYLGGSGDENNLGFDGYNGATIAVDALGRAWVAGMTTSANFPATANALRQTSYGSTDAFVTRLNAAGTAFDYSTYLGSPGDDRALALALDTAGNAYVTGFTNNSAFPTTAGAFQTAYRGSWETFVAKFDAGQSGTNSLVYASFLGGSHDDFGKGIAVDADGNAYVTGHAWSASPNFPTVNPVQAGIPNSFDVFVSKVNPAGTGLVYSTFFGAFGDDRGQAIAVDAQGRAHVTGFTNSGGFPQVNAVKTAYGGGSWGPFVFKLSPDGSSVAYSTLLGGNGDDRGQDIALDGAGNAYVAGLTTATDCPTTAGSAQPTANPGWDAFLFKLTDEANHAPTLSGPTSFAVRAGETVTFTVTAKDPDGQPVTLAASSLPSGATLDPNTGVGSWTPAAGTAVGTSGTFTITATDSGGLSAHTESAMNHLDSPARSASEGPSSLADQLPDRPPLRHHP